MSSINPLSVLELIANHRHSNYLSDTEIEISFAMYPTKNMVDYMSEMYRLFPSADEKDSFSPQMPMGQFLNQTMAQSSSSSDTSPDSFSDIFGHRFAPEHQRSPVRPSESPGRPIQRRELSSNHEQVLPKIHETPSGRQRPTVSKKIVRENWWHGDSDMSHPKSRFAEESFLPKRPIGQTSYELFPMDAGAMSHEFKSTGNSGIMASKQTDLSARNMSQFQSNRPHASTMSTSPYTFSMSPQASSLYPYASGLSPHAFSPSPHASSMSPCTTSNMSQWNDTMSDVSGFSITPPSALCPRSPGSSVSSSSAMSSRFFIKEPIVALNSLRPAGVRKMCSFCRKNGETPLVYTTHTVKEKDGLRSIVTCPILRSLVCATCGASGDDAHTISYCPLVRSTNNGRPLQPTTITLKNTRVKSNGRRRF